MQFATPRERTTFVAGFALILVGLVLILAGSTAIGLVIAAIGGVVLVYSILRVQRRAPIVRDESQKRPPR
jgi:drug/metabolite transporter superfamily protein YnfA